jgi:predicted transcriptional regulator
MTHRGKTRLRNRMAKSAYKQHSMTLEQAIAQKMSTDQKVISYALDAVNDLNAGRTVSATDVRKILREKREKKAMADARKPKGQFA